MSSKASGWKNPRDRLVRHKRKSSSRCLTEQLNDCSQTIEFATESCPALHASESSLSTFNPFKRGSPLKKKRKELLPEEDDFLSLDDIDDSKANDPFSLSIPSHISATTSTAPSVTRKPLLMRSRSTNRAALDFSGFDDVFNSSHPESPTAATAEFTENNSHLLPFDHRLGTKLRITSRSPFPWMKHVNLNKPCNVSVRLKYNEQFSGLQYIMCCGDHRKESNGDSAFLQAASIFYQFPHFSTCFPRMDSLLKQRSKLVEHPPSPASLEIMKRNWAKYFDKLFHSWKKGDHQSFYVCCPTFTVLFNKAEKEDISTDLNEDSMSCFQRADGARHMAIISPTTIGFRQFLKANGVEFETSSLGKKRQLLEQEKSGLNGSASVDGLFQRSPLTSIPITSTPPKSVKTRRVSFEIGEHPEDCSESGAKPLVEDPEKENSTDIEEDESPTKEVSGEEWLNQIGVSPSAAKIKRHRSMTTMNVGSSKDISIEENAAVIITGSSLQTLFNLLLTSPRITTSIAGPHAGLPATLLSSTAFVGASIMELEKNSQVVKRIGQPEEFVVELEGGPILPHSVQMAIEFIRSTGLTTEDPVQIHVNDRWAFSGLNGKDCSEAWNDITVTNSDYKWKSI